MKIVRIIARLNVGGPARHVVWLTEGLSAPEFSTTLIAGVVPPGEEDMSYFASERGVEPVYIRELSRELSLKDVVSLFKIFGELRRQKPDIVHTHTAKAGTVGRIAAFVYKWLTPGSLIGRPRRLRVFHTFHGHVFHSYYGKAKTRVFLFIERMLARLATDRIIVISEQQFDEIHKVFGVGRSGQFAVVPLGIDLPQPKPDRNTDVIRDLLGLDDETFIVGIVGRLTEIKDIPLFLSAAAEVALRDKEHPEDMHFVVIGDGHLRSSLENTRSRLGLDDLVSFLGNRDDVDDLLFGLDALALTSRNEGTPLSIIEAMAAGVPVISTSVGGVVDLVGGRIEQREGFCVCERGIAVDSRVPSDFANGLIYLAKNEKLREQVAISASRFVTQNYSKNRLVRDIERLYHDVSDA